MTFVKRIYLVLKNHKDWPKRALFCMGGVFFLVLVIRVTGSQPAFLKPDHKVLLGNPVSPSPRNSKEIAPVPSQSGSKSLDFNPPPTVATVPDLISTRGLDPGLFPGVDEFPGLKSEMTPVATLTPQPDGAKNKSTAQKSGGHRRRSRSHVRWRRGVACA